MLWGWGAAGGAGRAPGARLLESSRAAGLQGAGRCARLSSASISSVEQEAKLSSDAEAEGSGLEVERASGDSLKREGKKGLEKREN